MNITGIIIAAIIVGATGIIIGVLLGVASEKFKVEVDEERNPCQRRTFRATTAAAAASWLRRPLQRPLPRVLLLLTPARSEALPVLRKIAAIMGVKPAAVRRWWLS